MIPWSSAIFSGVSVVLALVFPVAAAIWFWRRTRVPFTTILVGALTFFVMQIVLRLPMLQVVNYLLRLPRLQELSFYIETSTTGLLIYSGFLALTAALFEEFGRVLFFKLFKRQGAGRTPWP